MRETRWLCLNLMNVVLMNCTGRFTAVITGCVSDFQTAICWSGSGTSHSETLMTDNVLFICCQIWDADVWSNDYEFWRWWTRWTQSHYSGHHCYWPLHHTVWCMYVSMVFGVVKSHYLCMLCLYVCIISVKTCYQNDLKFVRIVLLSLTKCEFKKSRSQGHAVGLISLSF